MSEAAAHAARAVAPDVHARRIQQILDTVGDGFCAFDRDWRYTYCNPAAEQHLGFAPGQAIGQVVWEAVPVTVGSPLEAIFRAAMTERLPQEAEVASVARPGVILELRAFPIDDGIGVSFHDITRARLQDARLRESEARFRAMADSAPAPVWLTAADGSIAFVNEAFADFAGKPAEALLGNAWRDLLHPEDAPTAGSRRAKGRTGPDAYWIEARFRHRSGDWRWMRASSKARFDAAGKFQGYVGLAVDMTEVRAAEARQQLLINELNHRVKNTLATVQSIVRQTLKQGVRRGAGGQLTERLMALSAAHNVLTRESWEGAELRDIAREALLPYDDSDTPRIALAGPTVRIAPNVALALSMGLHELATNATKHGALSAAGGRVEIVWTRSEDPGAVRLVWRETGGPAVRPPESTGFGSRLLGQGLAAELGHPAQLDYAPEGLVCTIIAPES